MASVARAAVGARYVSPAEMGVWLGLQVLVGYTSNIHGGVLFGVFRNVPFLSARGETEKAQTELDTSFTFVLAITIALGVAGLLVGPWLLHDRRYHIVLLADAYAVLNLAKSWYIVAFKAQKRFTGLSAASAASSLAAFITVFGIPRYGLTALLGGAVLQNAIELGMLAFRTTVPRLGIDRPVLVGQFRIGFLALLANVGMVAITTVDRTVMLRFLGTAAAGMFAVGAQITIMMPLVISVPLGVLTPLYFERAGKGQDLLPIVDNATTLIAYTFSWMIASAGLALRIVIPRVWPHLAPSVLACELALLGTYPYVLSGPIGNLFYAKDRQGIQLVITFVTAALMFATAWIGVRATGTIAGAEGGAAIGMFVYFVLTTLAAFNMLGHPLRRALTFGLRGLAPMVVATGTAVAGTIGLRAVLPNEVTRAVVVELAMTAAMAPFLLRARALVRRARAR